MRTLGLFLSIFWFCFLCLAHAAEKPTLAIINKLADPRPGDLLFSKLSGGDFILVERDRLADAIREQKLSGLTRENNVRTGRLLGADALLFVESEKGILRLRLVETAHGERISDELFPLAHPDVPALAENVRARLSSLAARLRLPARERVYIALDPVSNDRPGTALQESLATLSALIGAGLAQQERIIVLERDKLASVAAEQPLTGKSASDLTSAGVIIHAHLRDSASGKLQLEYQIQRLGNESAKDFAITVDRRHLAEGAAEIRAKIIDALGVAVPPTTSEGAEAPRQFHRGVALLHAQLFEPALRCLETACLLDPANETYARTYLGGVAECIYQRTGLDVESAAGISAADYLFYTERLRSAIAVALAHPPALSAPLAKGDRLSAFLVVHNPKLDADILAEVAACRSELREFFERFAAADPSGWEVLGDNCSAFFENPRAALDYLRSMVEAGRYPYERLRMHMYPQAAHWDRPAALVLWNSYLDELLRKRELAAQFTALAARCYLQGAFSGYYSAEERGRGRAAVQQLFTWLQASNENLLWVLTHEKWDIYLRVWEAFDSLPLEEQDHSFEVLMPAFLAGAKGSERYIFEYLSRRYVTNVANKKAPQDTAKIRDFFNRALDRLATTNPALHKETLADLSDEPALAKLLHLTPGPSLPMPDIPGGVLLYDSARQGAIWQDFNRAAGLVEGDILWIAAIQEKGFVITRVEISQRTCETCIFPVPGTNSLGNQLAIARSAGRLYVADGFRALVISVADHAPFLEAKRCEILGPKFGSDETAGTSERRTRDFDDDHPRFRQISGLIPAGDSIYVGLEQRTHDNTCRYGALYRWPIGAAVPELVCASDSLKPGPLNDCLPYSILGGRSDPGAQNVYLILQNTPYQSVSEEDGQRRTVVWKLETATGKFEWLSKARLGDSSERPRFLTATLFDIPGRYQTHYHFDLDTQTLSHAAGMLGGSDLGRGWYSTSQKADGVEYERVYRVEGGRNIRVLSLPSREFSFSTLLPTEGGLILILCDQISGGNSGVARGLAYLLPDEK